MTTNRWILSVCAVALIASVAYALIPAPETDASDVLAASTMTEDQKTLYALGLMMGRSLRDFRLSDAELTIVKQGLDASVNGTEPVVRLEEYGPKVRDLAEARKVAVVADEKARGEDYVKGAAAETGAQHLPSGLVMRTLTPGQGEQPTASSRVKVHYEGRLTDNTVFDSSIARGEPVTFALNQVIPCWTEGVQKMKVGEKAQLVCPSDIAYGDNGHPPTIPGGATLVFEVELLGIEASAPPKP